MVTKFRMVTDGRHTYAELDGKTIGQGVDKIEVVADADKVSVDIHIGDLNDFAFMEDGYFNHAEKVMNETEPPKKQPP